MNLADDIARHARERPEHPAIEDGRRAISYRALDKLVDDVAANLQGAGIRPGELVTLMLGNSADHLVAVLALARIGAVIFAVAPGLPRPEIERRLAGIAPAALVVGRQMPAIDGLRQLELREICRPAREAPQRFNAPAGHPLILGQSSGTTGKPKSFLRSHGQMLARFRNYIPALGWAPEDRYLTVIGMAFDMGRTCCLGMLHVGATVVVDRTASRDEMARAVRERRITFLHVAPTHVHSLLELEGEAAPMFPELRALFVGTAPVGHARRLAARRKLTANVVETFGCNEVGLLATARPAGQDARPEAVGRIIAGVEAGIVGADDRPRPAGQLGLLRFRVADPPTVYLNDPEASARAFRDGWFYPGDLASLDADGFLFHRGRADDVINNAGAKFYPVEVEEVLLQHPAVAEAAAIAWPHPQLGQTAAAAVRPRSTVDGGALRRFCAERLPGYMVPRPIAMLAKLPKDADGKVDKAALKALLEASLARRKPA